MAVILFNVFMFSPLSMAHANSGPVYWQGYPSSEVMTVEKNSPIIVLNEDLVFDFTDQKDADYSISGKVTAVYEMQNPSDKPQAVQMAFPFVESLNRLSADDIVISADSTVLPYQVYLGDVVESHGSGMENSKDKEDVFDFAGIINSLTDESYQANNFTENEKAVLHILEVQPTTAERINFAVDFCFDSEKTKVLTKGFNRYERDEEKTRIASWCYEPKTLEILVLGEAVEFSFNAFSDGELQEKTALFTYQVKTREVELKPYLLEYVKEIDGVRNSGYDLVSETGLYNLYAKSLDNYLTKNNGICSEHDILDQEYQKRILLLLYTVDFPPRSKRTVSISYRTSGTMDKRNTVDPVYSFDYILNPAENWREFKNLNLEIITPEKVPYIIESSLELAKKDHNRYGAALAGLPADDLSFTLYAKEKITLWDQVAGYFQKSLVYFLFLFFAPLLKYAAVILAGIVAVIVFAAKHRRKL